MVFDGVGERRRSALAGERGGLGRTKLPDAEERVGGDQHCVDGRDPAF
jgi:hypothetical protein